MASNPPRGTRGRSTRPPDDATVVALVHALEVQQLELQLQNQELRSVVGEMQRTNDALAASRDAFRALFDFAPVACVTVEAREASYEISDANRGAIALLAAPLEHLVATRLETFVAADDRPAFTAFVRSVFETGAGRSDDLRLHGEGAPPVDVRFEGVVIAGHAARPCCVLAIVDVTARKRAELARRDVLEEVLAVVSHDMRGPLSAIWLAADGLLHVDLPRIGRSFAQTIQRASRRAERLMVDLLGLAHLESGQLQLARSDCDVGALVTRVCAELDLEATAAGCTVTTSVPRAPVRAEVDADRMYQALSNLLRNAFVHAGGAPIEVGVASRDDDVVFTVADHGPGVPASEQAHIFDRYRQGARRKGGVGLGLSIVKGIAAAHGGRVAVTSEPGHGARFEIVVPRANAR